MAITKDDLLLLADEIESGKRDVYCKSVYDAYNGTGAWDGIFAGNSAKQLERDSAAAGIRQLAETL